MPLPSGRSSSPRRSALNVHAELVNTTIDGAPSRPRTRPAGRADRIGGGAEPLRDSYAPRTRARRAPAGRSIVTSTSTLGTSRRRTSLLAESRSFGPDGALSSRIDLSDHFPSTSPPTTSSTTPTAAIYPVAESLAAVRLRVRAGGLRWSPSGRGGAPGGRLSTCAPRFAARADRGSRSPPSPDRLEEPRVRLRRGAGWPRARRRPQRPGRPRDPEMAQEREPGEAGELLDAPAGSSSASPRRSARSPARRPLEMKRSAGGRQIAFAAPCAIPYAADRLGHRVPEPRGPAPASAAPACIAPSRRPASPPR